MKKIILTGGGTAGHVTPNIALMPRLKELGYEIHYVGSYEGIEKKLIEELGIPYHGVSSGKLRRYFDFRNFIDPFKVVIGYLQSKKLMRKIKPDIVFSKGGFVSMPVTRAAAKKHIPVILHESDMTPGLANRLALKKADKICRIVLAVASILFVIENSERPVFSQTSFFSSNMYDRNADTTLLVRSTIFPDRHASD